MFKVQARAPALLVLIAAATSGCCSLYKNALCDLGNASAGVATHYGEYVAAEPDAARKAARSAEADEFKRAVEAAKQKCAAP